MPISDDTRADAERLIRRYPVARAALLPLLHLVQSDEGYVSEDGIALCAELLHLTKAEVGAVSTFYTMYKREPFGDYLLSVCTNPTCKVAGAQDIYDAYVARCGGAIDAEAGVMVEHAECLGICDAAPVVQINYEMYGPVTQDQAMDLLDQARAGDPPASNWSGAVPPTFRQVEREFSGAEDGIDDQLIQAAQRQARAQVPPAYRTGETDIPVTHPGGDPAGHGGHDFREAAGLALASTPSSQPGPEQTTDPETQREAADVAEETGSGVEEELARLAGSEAPPGPSPAAQEKAGQPQQAPETPQESDPDARAAGGEELSGDETSPGAAADPEDSREQEDD